jgi:hypothetical protein
MNINDASQIIYGVGVGIIAGNTSDLPGLRDACRTVHEKMHHDIRDNRELFKDLHDYLENNTFANRGFDDTALALMERIEVYLEKTDRLDEHGFF